jgi:hypothetical protein
MTSLRLIVWNAEEAALRAQLLRASGYEVDHEVPTDYKSLRSIRENPPAAVIIDLSRAPSKGRDVALSLHNIPIVFVGGTPTNYPQPVCATWDNLPQVLATLPAPMRKAGSALAAYAGTPLLKKLGIKSGMTVNLQGAPPAFEDTLGDLPEGVELRRDSRAKSDLTLWFIRSQSELDRELPFLAAARLWIVWPKGSPGLTQLTIRKSARSAGYTDYKIASIDRTWSGMLFTSRPARKERHFPPAAL